MFSNEQYQEYRRIFQNQRLPVAFIDLQAFDANIAYVRQLVQGTGRTVRLGTKSIRCEHLLRRIFNLGGPLFRGLLTFTVEETAWLVEKGYDDMIVAYPTVQAADMQLLQEMARLGKQIYLMVDCLEHLRRLSVAGKEAGVELSACIEVDMAYRPAGVRSLHLGLRRSPLRTPTEVIELVRESRELNHVSIKAVMGYEGHIAGLSDAVPGQAFKNKTIRWLKGRSITELTRRRARVVQCLRDEGLKLEIVNGGGSGSLRSTLADQSITEVTVGSGFYCPALFHHFKDVKYRPAALFATQMVRKPANRIITCQGGGYPASGPAGADKLPAPVLPPGLKYLPLEGAGEVQTPLALPEDCPDLELGAPIFFQHAKAGELCERFNQLWLVQAGEIVAQVPTYRGEGKAFL
jgi:D-serine deaminase-like pyridoxal phosphate-dependent protein